MQCILLKTAEGVDIIYPVSRSIEDIILLELPPESVYSIIDQASIPPTRVFRGAWVYQEEQLTIDLNIARVIQKDRWRAARAPLLAQLDLDYIRAMETSNTSEMAAVVSKKQALRDITGIDLSGITTADGIESFWPEILI